MSLTTIFSNNAPEPVGAYSQAVVHAGILYVSGQIALTATSSELINATFEAEVRQVFSNLKAVAIEANTSLAKAIKLNIYLTDLSEFPTVNTVMQQEFDAFGDYLPARACVEVSALPKGATVEVDAIIAI